MSNNISYTYAGPEISSLLPVGTGGAFPSSGGFPLQIAGTNFAPQMSVSIQTGASTAINCPVVAGTATHTGVTCTMPAGLGIPGAQRRSP